MKKIQITSGGIFLTHTVEVAFKCENAERQTVWLNDRMTVTSTDYKGR